MSEFDFLEETAVPTRKPKPKAKSNKLYLLSIVPMCLVVAIVAVVMGADPKGKAKEKKGDMVQTAKASLDLSMERTDPFTQEKTKEAYEITKVLGPAKFLNGRFPHLKGVVILYRTQDRTLVWHEWRRLFTFDKDKRLVENPSLVVEGVDYSGQIAIIEGENDPAAPLKNFFIDAANGNIHRD